MGKVADMMLDGTLCMQCGVYVPGEAQGFPRYCSDRCKRTATMDQMPSDASKPKMLCTVCGKKIKVAGEADHMRNAHSEVKS